MLEISFSPLLNGVYTATAFFSSSSGGFALFQPPTERGVHCNDSAQRHGDAHRGSFSPLLNGVYTATQRDRVSTRGTNRFQPPTERGVHCNELTHESRYRLLGHFQPPTERGVHCN